MPYLREIQFDCLIDVPAFVRVCRAQLTAFTYYPPVCDAMYEFLSTQTTLTTLSLGDLNRGPWSSCYKPNILPDLTCLRCPARDLVYLVPSRPVQYVKFWYSTTDTMQDKGIHLPFLQQLSIIRMELAGYHLAKPIDMAALLPNLTHLVIIQDRTWGKRYKSVRLVSRFPVCSH